MRWLGFGCFSPLMEVGPTENRGFWNNVEAPHHDPDLIATWRLYTKTRMKLISYLQDLAEEARATGTPIARPLFLEYPEQQPAWEDWQTYLFGPDILVSIIWEPGKTSQRLYLPAGETWVDAWDKKEHAGGKYIEVEAPPFKTPVFLRQGTSLDLGDLNALYNQSLEMARQKFDLAELEAKEGWR
jgi:alpha-glucosidase (family GH31 glycosyl hydrolase)